MTDPQTPELVVEPAAAASTTSRRIARTCGWVAWRWCTGLPMRQRADTAQADLDAGESSDRSWTAAVRWSVMLLPTAVAVVILAPRGVPWVGPAAILVGLPSLFFLWVHIYVGIEKRRYIRTKASAAQRLPSEQAGHCCRCRERGAR